MSSAAATAETRSHPIAYISSTTADVLSHTNSSWDTFCLSLLVFALPALWSTKLREQLRHLKMGDSESIVAYSTIACTMLNFERELVSKFELAESVTFGLIPELKIKVHDFQLLLVSPSNILLTIRLEFLHLNPKVLCVGVSGTQRLIINLVCGYNNLLGLFDTSSELNMISEHVVLAVCFPTQHLDRFTKVSLSLDDQLATPIILQKLCVLTL
ncbi:hypothetical protein VP01_4243g1 [Puccinia sorghi]|uniref:Uncharacterized protein n=1 Tax=Puccinia sorghi TaxID=27349 RepID=A0A0L6URB0_9BASI|nr:hypothetical protein VP01_4243g1 [Puccinia sorghi]